MAYFLMQVVIPRKIPCSEIVTNRPQKIFNKAQPYSILGYLPGSNFQVYPLLLLQVMDHRKQVACLGIPFWPEHTHEALAQFIEDPGSFLEPDRRVDIVTQHRLAGVITPKTS